MTSRFSAFFSSAALVKLNDPVKGSVRAEVTLRASSDGRSVIFSCQITNGTRRPIPQVIFPDLRGLVDVVGPDLERGNESEVTVEDAPQNQITTNQAVQRTGASRSGQETNRTSAAAGSGR
jgi:hypothetical protein